MYYRADDISELRIAKNHRKGIKGKIITLIMLKVSDGGTDVMNGFKSPRNLKTIETEVKRTPIA